jgi:hypothetical protein
MSVPRSIDNIRTTVRGRGMARSTKAMKGNISGMLLVRM